MEATQAQKIQRLKELITLEGGMRHPGAYPNFTPTSPPRRGRPFSTSLYFYFLFRQAWPFVLLLIGIGVCLNYEYTMFARALPAIPGAEVARSSSPGGGSNGSLALHNKGQQPLRYYEHAPVYSFILFSSYRTGAKTIAALGLSGLMLRDAKKLGKCLWKEHAGGHRVEGKLQAFYPGEHHNLKYEAIVIVCTLEESTEHDTGGDLLMQIDGDDVLVYREEAGAFPMADPKPPFQFNIVHCVPPMASPANPRRLYEWMEYHIQQGVNYFIFYDAGGIDEEVMAMLEAYTEMKMAEVVEARKIDTYETWAHGSLLLYNDCAMRTRFTAKWTTFWETNEYFNSEAVVSMAAVLEEHAGKPYVTFGSRWWSLEKCAPDPDKSMWAVERMIFQWPHVYCVGKDRYPRWEMCLDFYGFRRFAADPRKVTAIQIHRTEVPKIGGVDVDTDIARINRWPGLVDRVSKACNQEVAEKQVIDWWVVGKTIAHLAQAAKAKPTAQFRTRSPGR